MKNKCLALIALIAITIQITSVKSIDVVSANPSPLPFIEIFSPISAPDAHSTSSIPLKVRVNVQTEEPDITFISYSLDGEANITLTTLTRENGLYYWTNTEGVFEQGNAFSAETSLDNLKEGKHALIVYSHAADNTELSKTREFTVDFSYIPPQVPNTAPPNMTIVSPLPVTYDNSSIPLYFGANIWLGAPEITALRYSVDGNANVTITDIGKTGMQNFGSQAGYTYHVKGGLMLTNLADGNHTLWVYSQDASGNEMAGSVEFTVDTNNETPQKDNLFTSQILLLIIIAIVVVVILSIAILLFRRRVKKNPTTQRESK